MEIPDEAVFVKLKLPDRDVWMTKADYVALYNMVQFVFAHAEHHVASPADAELIDVTALSKRITV